MTITASVVVPTQNRAESLRRCLEALFCQDWDADRYEIVVVGDGADEATRRLVEDIAFPGRAGNPDVRFIPLRTGRGPAAARNVGWRAARGELIAFTDDDCIPERSWLSSGVVTLLEGYHGASGRVRVPLTPVPTDYERNIGKLEEGRFVTASCFYRRETLAGVGGFDETFSLAWREDTDLHFRLLEGGYRLGEAERAIVCHPPRTEGWGICLREQRKSEFNALLYKKHPTLYRKYVQSRPPLEYYGICLGWLSAYALSRRWSSKTWFVGILPALALTARFLKRRLAGTSHAPAHVFEMLVTSFLIPPLALFWRLRGAVRFKVLFL